MAQIDDIRFLLVNYSYDQRIHRYFLNSLIYQREIPWRRRAPFASEYDVTPTF